ncbi:nSTAND1 domain-containing NTPase [Rhodococcoides kyotonense]|uniref:WD40 repeat n=1 Tax=Rhodococcoides kyotonense TaxID=398843 RepID=A0A239KG32_9NOCA|nr:helix-turn-helix domain-containing protein [Rhodococcus kyotonensis]SNT17121.1 WD40 repeat [Rhodococcus kyotonensis]
MNTDRPEPSEITSRADLAAGLRALRESSGVTYRELVERSGGLHGTVSGWFSGHHVPVKASADMFDRVLSVCGVDSKAERQQWWEAVGRVRSSPGRKQSRRGPAPYKGLESFDAADRDWFFGRGEVTDALVERVDALAAAGGGVVVVLGASGSGKSSVLRAGLAGRRAEVTVRSGLADVHGFAESEQCDPVLVFDQIEELWTLASDDERTAFLTSIERVLDGSDVVVVFGLRADFYQNAVAEDVLMRGLVDNPVIVGRLGPKQVSDVIVEPARKAGMTVDDALLRALIKDFEPRGSTFAHDQGALPMLSHALLSTWQLAKGTTLTVDDYHATGGLAGAVQQSAETVFASLTTAQHDQARRIFVRLVNVDDDVLTRRRVARVELFRGDGVDADVESVIEAFTASRLLTVEEESVSVTHEVLLTAWDRLRLWIADDRQWLVTHRRLTDAAVLWDETGRENSAVLPRTRLEAVQESMAEGDRHEDLNAVERDFLDASRDRVHHFRDRRRRRRRVMEGLTAALTVVTIVAVTFAGVAFFARADADSRRADAEAALAGQVAGTAERLRELDPGLSVHLALAAYDMNPTTAARSALLDASAIHAPVRLPGVSGETRARIDSTGSTLATAGSDGVVRLWSMSGSSAQARGGIDLAGPGSTVALAFAPSAPVVAVGGAAGTSLWDVGDPDSPVELSTVGNVETSKTVAFGADGRTLALVSPEGAVSLWDVASTSAPRLVAELDTAGAVNAVAFSPDGSVFATAGVGRSMRVWNTVDLDVPVVDISSDGSTNDFLSLTFSPDGRSLAAGTTARNVARWAVDPRGGLTELPALDGFTSYVNDVAFSSDGSELAAVSSDNSIRTWDANTGDLHEVLPGSSVALSVAYSPDDSVLITTGQDGITRLWPLPGPVMSGQTDTVYINPIDGDGTRLVAGVGARGDGLRLWDVTDPDRPVSASRNLTAATPDDPLTGAAAMSWDGTLVAGGTASGAFQLWNVESTLDPIPIGGAYPAVRTLVGALAFTRSGDLLAVSPQNSTDIALWDVREPARPVQLATFEVGNNPQVMAFSPDGQVLAVPTLGDVVELWDVTSPEAPRSTTTLAGFEDDASTVAFSPDGRMLAAGSADGSVRLWNVDDLETPQHIARIDGPRDAVYSLAFDPSGTRIVAGVGGRSMWIWDISDPWNPHTYATLTAYGTRVNDAVFTARGDAIVGGGPAQDLRVWRTDPDEVRSRICEAGGLSITPDEWEQYLPGTTYRELC